MSLEEKPRTFGAPQPVHHGLPATTALERELRRFRAHTPRSRAEYDKAKRLLPFGVCSNFRAMEPYPVYMRRASGSRIEDLDGHEYVDWAMAQTTLLTGHAHPIVLAAVRTQSESGTLTCLPHPLTSELAQVIQDRFRLEQMRFVNSGSEAVGYALRVARAATGRDAVIKFDICYHGSSPEVMLGRGLTDLPADCPGWLGFTEWTTGIPKSFFEKTFVASYNEIDSVRALFKEHPGAIAAIVVEPLALNLGVIPPREGFLEGLREICDLEGALLVFDEVKMGCKLGPLGAGEYFGVTPDLVAMAKSIGGGFPIGLFGGKREFMKEIEEGGVTHVGTYTSNPISLSAALATLTRVLTRETYDRIFATNRALADGLRDIIRRTGLDAQVVEFGANGSLFMTRRPIETLQDFVKARHAAFPVYVMGMLNRGILFGPGAEDPWTVSVQHTEEDVEATLRAFREIVPQLS
ncbi:MAG: aspartate aminotransferase family protein [Acidobacteria bacterium]|nr:aspartate aminotransferase family protein [Acidobacteriota bacterium]